MLQPSPLQHCVHISSSAFRMENQDGEPIFKKGDQRIISNYQGITLLSLLGKVNAKLLGTESSAETLQIEEEQSWPCNSGPAPYPCYGAGKGNGFAQSAHMCFMDLRNAYNHTPRCNLLGVLQEFGGLAFSPCTAEVGAWLA